MVEKTKNTKIKRSGVKHESKKERKVKQCIYKSQSKRYIIDSIKEWKQFEVW